MLEKKDQIINAARRVFAIESQAVAELAHKLTDDFFGAVVAILNCSGRVVVCGMGKSGHISRKLAATLASTGTASFFVHAAEAFHGDLGMISSDDIFIALSNSGETDEIIRLLPALHNNGNKIIAICGNLSATLPQHSDFVLHVPVIKEACPLTLAPTSSTTAALAMGDALAVALMEQRDFKPENFARFHPGGDLGRKLLTKVKNVMRQYMLPFVTTTTSFHELVLTMTEGKLGMAMVVEAGELIGIITDGDLRRAWKKYGHLQGKSTSEIMTKHPKTIDANEKLITAEEIMIQHKITTLIVKEKATIVGVLQLYGI